MRSSLIAFTFLLGGIVGCKTDLAPVMERLDNMGKANKKAQESNVSQLGDINKRYDDFEEKVSKQIKAEVKNASDELKAKDVSSKPPVSTATTSLDSLLDDFKKAYDSVDKVLKVKEGIMGFEEKLLKRLNPQSRPSESESKVSPLPLPKNTPTSTGETNQKRFVENGRDYTALVTGSWVGPRTPKNK